jgi:hypothetical protein
MWLLSLGLALVARAANPPPLLENAVEDWLGEREHWAFTQRAVEYDDGKPRERLERYDPSKPGDGRWTLLAIDGKPPTEEQRAAWAKKKFKKNRRKFDSPLGDYFDFKDATILSETPKLVRYQVPLRNDKRWLFDTDKVRVIVTINKETHALEHLTANVREPVKVLLGIAKITDGAVDLNFLPFDVEGPSGPDSARPTGSARVSVSKPGGRVEFTWSEFTRVVPSNANDMARTGR